MKYSMCPQLLRRALGLDFWLHDFGNHKKLPFVNLTVTSLNSALPGLFGPPEYFTEQNDSRLTIMLSCPTGPSFVKIFRFVHISLEFSLRFSFLSQFFPHLINWVGGIWENWRLIDLRKNFSTTRTAFLGN